MRTSGMSFGEAPPKKHRSTASGFLRYAAVALVSLLVLEAARGDVTKEAAGVLAQLEELQKAVDSAREHDVFFSADMSAVSNLRSLVGLTRSELAERLGPGQVCVDRDHGRDCLLWRFYWRPFRTEFIGASPALVALFDERQLCTDIKVATME